MLLMTSRQDPSLHATRTREFFLHFYSRLTLNTSLCQPRGLPNTCTLH